MPMFKNFKWPKAEEEADEKLIHNVREHGCHILNVYADPPFSFSIGLALNYGQAEIVIFGMDASTASRIINVVRNEAASGKKYADGDLSSDILLGLNVCFLEVPLDLYGEYLGTAIWFYRNSPRPFPCLQLVWPDRGGRFPWQAGCDAGIRKDQPILKSIS
jgi:hypothetical protein